MGCARAGESTYPFDERLGDRQADLRVIRVPSDRRRRASAEPVALHGGPGAGGAVPLERQRQQPANFHRRVTGRGIIEPTSKPESRYSQRPGQLFRFTRKEPDLSAF